MSFHYVYHPDFEPKVVKTEEYEKFLQEGWFDTPAKFPVKEEKNAESSDSLEEVKRSRGRPPKNTEEKKADAGI